MPDANDNAASSKRRILVLVCARGGSSGLKNKNILSLAGKPLIAWTIKQALNWPSADRVVCSTENDEIADIARSAGAEVPFVRPAELATATASKGPVIRHALQACEAHFRAHYDLVVDLYPTSPLRTIEDLDKCLEIFDRFRPKTLFSVVPAQRNPYFNMVEANSNGTARLCKALDGPTFRRQDAPPVYAMNASIYFYRRDFILEDEDAHAINDDCRFFVMDPISGVDVDSSLDLQYLDFLVRENLVSL